MRTASQPRAPTRRSWERRRSSAFQRPPADQGGALKAKAKKLGLWNMFLLRNHFSEGAGFSNREYGSSGRGARQERARQRGAYRWAADDQV